MQETGFAHWLGVIPWRREWLPILIFLPEESHGQRSLVGWLYFMGSQRVEDNWVTNRFFHFNLAAIYITSKCDLLHSVIPLAQVPLTSFCLFLLSFAFPRSLHDGLFDFYLSSKVQSHSPSRKKPLMKAWSTSSKSALPPLGSHHIRMHLELGYSGFRIIFCWTEESLSALETMVTSPPVGNHLSAQRALERGDRVGKTLRELLQSPGGFSILFHFNLMITLSTF